MFANIHQEIDLTKGLPTVDTLKNNIDDFSIDIHITADEFIKLFKNYVRRQLDIDLDLLDIFIILDINNDKISLDIEELEENDPNELLYLLEEFKRHFGRSIFEIRAVINLNILFRKIFSNCNSYGFDKDGILTISYSLNNFNKDDIDNYNNLEEE